LRTLLEIRDRFQKRLEVSFAAEDRLAVVATVDDVVDQSIGDGTQGAWHAEILT